MVISMKRILIILIVIAAVLSSCRGNHSDIKLLYWNIQNGMWSDQENNYDNFVSFVKEQNPDICVWCEAASIYYSATARHLATRDEAFLPYNWDSLAERYGHEYVYLGGWRDDYPQVITSRYPIRNVKRILGNQDTIVSHGAGWATIELRGRSLNLVTLHTWPQRYAYRAEDKAASAEEHGGDYFRAAEMEYICNATVNSVPEAADQYWLMMGDFNSRSRVDSLQYDYPSDSPAYLVHNYIRNQTPYIDVINEFHNGEFHTSTAGHARIDYIYATPAMYGSITSAAISDSAGWIPPYRDPAGLSNFYHPSDHLPIVIEFSVR